MKIHLENLGFGSIQNPGLAASFRQRQVHGIRSVQVKEPGEDCGQADAFWTLNPQVVVSVVTADCVPILLKRNDGKAVAAIHAGWRGTLANIVDTFFENHRPSEWQAILGPSIRSCCYEVSEELIQSFIQRFPELSSSKIEPKMKHLDLIAVNQFQLEKLGVLLKETHPACTFCTRDEEGKPVYYSYRRGDRQSRQFSWIKI